MTDNNLLQLDEGKFYRQLFKDYKKTKQDLEEYIDIIRKWAATQPHFPEKPSYRILRFVILYNKFSLEKAKQKLDMYYTMRNLIPKYFSTTPFTPDMVLENKVWYIVPLPKTDDENIRIIYHRLNPEYSDPKYFIHEKVLIQLNHFMEFLIQEDMCYRFHYIFDCNGFKLGHATNINPMAVKNGTVILENVYSNRIQSFYMVNVPSFLESVINNVLKPVLHEKLRKRLKVHASSNILLQVFGKERMPKDVGGEEKSAKELSEMVLQRYEHLRKRFEEAKDLKVDESLRPAKLKNDDILGYYGNFRQLNVD